MLSENYKYFKNLLVEHILWFQLFELTVEDYLACENCLQEVGEDDIEEIQRDLT